jgi:hypothetical protein
MNSEVRNWRVTEHELIRHLTPALSPNEAEREEKAEMKGGKSGN